MKFIKPLQVQAYESLKEMILSGTFEEKRIYSETKVSQDLGISRTPLRDAIQRLAQEGYIDIIPSKGFTLHRLTRRDVIETYEVRSAIEGYCIRKLAQESKSTPVKELLIDLTASLEKQRLIFETSGDAALFAEEDERFHHQMVSHSGNEVFIEIFELHVYKIKKLLCLSYAKEGRMKQALSEHQEIIQAVRDGSWQAAYDAMLRHIDALEYLWEGDTAAYGGAFAGDQKF